MNSEPNSEIPPPLDSHRQGLQITLRVGRKPVGSSVGGLPPLDSHCQGLQITLRVGRKPVGSSVGELGAHSVYRILHENVGSLITS